MQFYEKNKECFIYFKIPLFIKYHHSEQGDGTALGWKALTADISRADVVLHRAGLAGGRSAKRRTGSVPLGHWSPPLTRALSPEGPFTASPRFGSSLNTHEVSTAHLMGAQGVQG